GTLATVCSGVIQVNSGSAATLADITLDGALNSQNNTTTSLGGTIHNLGQISLGSTGNLTDVVTTGEQVTLTGGGTILLGHDNDRIRGAGTLVNTDNTIRGFGALGTNAIGIVNQADGLVDA